jgi:hypothetical protein
MRFRQDGSRAVSGRCLIVAVLIVVMGFALFASSSFAAFTRPFVKTISGTPAGSFGALGGIAMDGAGDLWVADRRREQPFEWDEFDSSGGFVKTVEPEEHSVFPNSLAIEDSTSIGHFYVTGETDLPYLEVFADTGHLLTNQQVPSDPYVAVDNAPSTEVLDPSRCTLSACTAYLSHGIEGPGGSLPKGIERLEVNTAGEPKGTPFACETVECKKYIEGDQIVGTPEGRLESIGPTPEDVAVDSHGNIYVIGTITATMGNVETLAVYEYESSGKFVRSFTGGETPGLEGNETQDGWGGLLNRVTVDSFSGHLLVAVGNDRGNSSEAGAIDEFDTTTGEYLGQITGTNPKEAGAHLHNPEAMTVDSHGDLYVVDENTGNRNPELVHVVDEYGPPGLDMPSVRIGETSERTTESAVASGSVDPDGQALSQCAFEYIEQAEFEAKGFTGASVAQCEPAASEISKEADLETYYPVTGKLTGLTSGTTYRYRLVASTLGGGAADSESLAFTAPAVPVIESSSASDLSSTFAELHAQIDPRGAKTTYQFEYLTEAAYQANGESLSGPEPPTSAPVPAADIGSGGATGDISVSVAHDIGGLAPSTAYRFRVVASNEVGIAPPGEVGEFATLPPVSPGLPDHRAYEMLTPPDKGSSGDMFGLPPQDGEFLNSDVGYPSESGDEFLLKTTAAFGPFPASGQNAYVFSRDPQGWGYTSLSSPSLGVQGLFPVVFDPFDLSSVGLEDNVGSTSSAAGSSSSNLVGPPGGPYTNLHSDAPVYSLGERSEEETEIVGAARDLSDVVLESKNHALAPGSEEQDKGSNALYEADGSGECTTVTANCALINLKTNGELVSRCGAVLGLGTHSLGVPFEPESPFADGVGGTYGKTHDAVSADGSKVIFTAPDPFAVNDGPECWGGASSPQTDPPQLYVRSNGTTTEVSAPETGAPETGEHYIAEYVGAAENSSRIFFMSEGELTENDTDIHDPELYEWRAEGIEGATGLCTDTNGCLTRVSSGEADSPTATTGAGVFAVPQVSASGSAVYFLAHGRLTTTQPTSPQGGGELNVYRYETATAAIAYVTSVSRFNWTRTNGNDEAAYGVGFDPREDWYTTPNGRYLLFGSTLKLTAQPDPGGLQLYRYQAPSTELPEGSLLCVSCAPESVEPVANPSSEFSRSAMLLPDAETVRGMSDDGSYVFFDTAQALVPQDTNGTLDVYEWHNGTISLISSGQDSPPSYFLGASPDGSNVFFGTHAQLVPQDTDAAGDLYDARICTTEDPCIKPPVGETAQCEGGACQNPPSEPIDTTPKSETSTQVRSKAKPTSKAKPLTRAQKLSRALAACKKGPKRKRGSCERQARRNYGPKSKKSSDRKGRR